MDQKDREKIEAHYRQVLTKHPDGPFAVDWNAPEAQVISFLELVGISDELDGASILDVGTGIGDFYGFLKNQGLKVNFTGIDILPEYIEKAKKKYPDQEFLVKNILTDPIDQSWDYVFASGPLTVRIKNHEIFVQRMIKRMYELCNKGVSFNLLSSYSYSQSPEYQRDQTRYYPDPAAIFTFCKSLTPRVVLNHDWFHSSFSLYLYKEYSRAISSIKKILPVGKEYDGSMERLVNCYLNLGLYQSLYDFLSSASTHPKVEDTMGVCLFQMEKFDDAINHFKKAIELDPKFTSPIINLGNTLFRKELYQEASKEYEKALALDPKNEGCFEMLSLAQLASGEFGAAEKTISQIQNPALAQYLKGELFSSKKQISSAITEYQKALDINPNYADAFVAIGCLYEKKEKYDLAAEAFLSAQKLMPDNYIVKIHLASCYLQLRLPEEALYWAESVIDSAESCNLRGMIYLQLNQKDQAIKEFEKSKSLDPNYLEAWINLGGLAIEEEKYDLAEQNYRRVLEISKDEKEAILGLARCALAKNDTETCLDLLKGAPSSADTDFLHGDAMLSKENYEEAKKDFEKAVSKDRNFVSAYIRLGEACQMLNKKEEARKAYRRALKIDPELSDIKQRLKKL